MAPNPNAAESSKKSNSSKVVEPTPVPSTSPVAPMEPPTREELQLISQMIDDVIFCECLQVHRAAKMGLIFIEPGDEAYSIKDGLDVDIFGQPLSKKKQYNCICPNCNRNLAASRLAPHLEKCMSMGRHPARAASQHKS